MIHKKKELKKLHKASIRITAVLRLIRVHILSVRKLFQQNKKADSADQDE